MITEIALPRLTLRKIKRVFKWWAIINRHIMQLLDGCRNLQLLKLKPHVDISRATKILSHVWGSKTLKSLVCVIHGVLDLIPYRPMLRALGERPAQWTYPKPFIYTAGALWEEYPVFMAINVNRAANFSVNYHRESKQGHAFRKANSFMRKAHARYLRMTPLSTYSESRVERKGGRKKKFLKVAPLELFYIKGRR